LTRAILAVFGASVALLFATAQASAATFVVNSTADPGDGSCGVAGCTLREAITAANATATEADQISISATGTISLLTELPPITDETTITGPGPGNLTVQPAASVKIRVFYMNGATAGDTIRIQGLTISNGAPQNFGGTPLNGGGVFVEGQGINTLENVVITGNTGASGGGILVLSGATLDVIGSTISNNDAVDANGEGGGIANSGQLTVKSSTIAGNRVTLAVTGTGGGIWMAETGSASTLVSNSTIAGNSVPSSGGGIYLGNGSLFVESSTIARNRSDSDDVGFQDGGGIYIVPTLGEHRLANTILAENVRGTASPIPNQCGLGNMSSSLTSDGYNLRSSSGDSCDTKFGSTDLVDPNPLLGQLSSNGGPTRTIPLLPGSPAQNAGNPLPPSDLLGSYPACKLMDQRGSPRGGGAGVCDIGAFEVQPTPPGAGGGGGTTTPPPSTTTTSVTGQRAAAIRRCKKKFRKGTKKRKKCLKKARKLSA
jgi:CSLREA domain-containing protein